MLKLKKVKKSYNEKLFETSQVEFNQGLFLITGENGSGKTTLFNLISKNDLNYDGEIFIDDKNIKDIDKEILRQRFVTYVKQDIGLFQELTVEENFQILIKDEINEIEKLDYYIEKLDLRDVFNKNKKIKKLSGGERQKIQIIIGLLHNTKILLLDEIDNNLDSESINVLSEILNEHKGIILLITHHVEYYEEIINGEYNIENNQFKIIKTCENNYFKENGENKKELIKQDIKILSRYNIFNRILISIVMFVMLISTAIIISFIARGIQYIKPPNSNFKFSDTSSTISVPYENQLYYSVGDDSWRETTPYYFTEEQINQLSNLDYVTKVEPIAGLNGGLSMEGISTEYVSYQIPPITINYDELEYEKYGLQDYATTGTNQIMGKNLMYPYEVLKNTPQFIYPILYGDMPSDESDEVIIDQYTAIAIASHKNLENIEDVIGLTINMNSDIVDNNTYQVTKGNVEFTISGIYDYNTLYKDQPKIYYSYSEKADIVKRNSCWLMDDVDSCVQEKFLDDKIDGSEKEFGSVPALYVEVSDKDKLKQLSQDVAEYDPYIYVDNNYTRNHLTNIVYLKQFIINSIILFVVFIFIFIMITKFLKKLFNIESKKVEKVLENYGFVKESINQRLNYEYIKIRNYLLGIIMIFVIYITLENIVYNKEISYFIMQIFTILIFMLIFKKIFKRR